MREPRLFSIADIHGRYDLLDKLLSTLYLHHDLDLSVDKLIFTGDYIDRGPDSFEVLERINCLTEEFPNNVIAIAGNHEYLMLDHIDGWDSFGLWFRNGGLSTLDSFRNNGFPAYPHYLIDWIREMPLYHEEPGFFFSHAPVPSERNRRSVNRGKPFTKEELIWSCHKDEKFFARKHKDGIIGVCGHMHALDKGLFEPRFYKHYIYGDAGCGCHPKAPLCAINVKTRDVIYAI